MGCELINDGSILWLQIPIQGSPAHWNHDTEYGLGDCVIPRFPNNTQADYMFQCIGFVGNSGVSQPSWPTVLGEEIIEGDNKWKCCSPTANPLEITKKEYYIIGKSITVE